MYQQPAPQPGVQTFPSQQPAVGSPQSHGPPAQPTMYQMPPGQPQPVFTGQSDMGQQGQPPQHYVPPGQSQPVFTGKPDLGQQGQPPQYYVPAGQPVQPVQPPVDEDEDIRTIKIDVKYLKSGLNGSRLFEFIFLSIAWPCVVVYSNRVLGFDGRANFFKDVTIFCWVMVILFQIVFIGSISKNKRYFRQPSYCILVSLGIQVVLTILLITCTVSFTIRGVDLFKAQAKPFSGSSTVSDSTTALIYAASIFGMLASLAFLDDILILSQMYAVQRSKEIAAAARVSQQPAATHPQQQVGAQAQFPPQPLLTQK